MLPASAMRPPRALRPLRPLLGWLAFGAAMCLLPAFVSTGTVRILIFANFLAIFSMSWVNWYVSSMNARVTRAK